MSFYNSLGYVFKRELLSHRKGETSLVGGVCYVNVNGYVTWRGYMFWAVGCASHSPSTRHTILIFRFFFTQLRMGLRIYARGISINGARPTPST